MIYLFLVVNWCSTGPCVNYEFTYFTLQTSVILVLVFGFFFLYVHEVNVCVFGAPWIKLNSYNGKRMDLKSYETKRMSCVDLVTVLHLSML